MVIVLKSFFILIFRLSVKPSFYIGFFFEWPIFCKMQISNTFFLCITNKAKSSDFTILLLPQHYIMRCGLGVKQVNIFPQSLFLVLKHYSKSKHSSLIMANLNVLIIMNFAPSNRLFLNWY